MERIQETSIITMHLQPDQSHAGKVLWCYSGCCGRVSLAAEMRRYPSFVLVARLK